MKPSTDIDLPFLSKLNEQQLAAVRCTDGPSLIVAGAGSGKTTVLTAKIAYLMECGVDPWNILALTFTNKAAREMRERIEGIAGNVKARSLWMGTFHSIFSRILRKEAHVFGFTPNYTIYQPSDTKSLLKAIIKERGLDDKVYKPALLADRISEAKNMLVSPKKYMENIAVAKRDAQDTIPLTGEIYNEYFGRCHKANAMDFDDLLLFTYILFSCYPEVKQRYSEKFRYILVDEYQDTNFAQFAILKLLAEEHQNISVVGDDAQSIYGFRGARIDNILNFDKDYKGTQVFRLERNYRSTQNIVNAANSLIKKNEFQIKKNIYSENEQGSPVVLSCLTSDIEEGEMVCRKIKMLHDKGVKYSNIAVLYRTNGQSRILEETMRKRNVPCVIFGSISFYDQKEVRDVLAYLRLITNQFDEEALRRIINYPARGIGNTTIEKIFKCAKENDVAPWNVVQQPDLYGLNVNKGTKTKLITFAEMIKGFVSEADSLDAYQMGQKVLKESGLLAIAQNDRSGEGRDVMDSYSSLLSGMSQFVDAQREEGREETIKLSDYLGDVALLTDSDKSVKDGDAVNLMTIHIAKGLEFDVVFVTGMEEGLFPNGKCFSSREIEEERRLFFVAITRAKKMCFLSYAKIRFRFGQSDSYEPSRFLNDIDSQYIKQEKPSFVSKNDKLREFFSDIDEFASYSETSRTPRKANTYEPVTRQTSVPVRNVPKAVPASRGRLKRLDSVADGSGKPANALGIKESSVVQHAIFGLGEVKAVEESPAGPKAVIVFSNCGEKKLLLKYAKLKVVK